MKEWICHDWLHRTSPERFSAGIQSGQLEHLTEFLTRELSVLGKSQNLKTISIQLRLEKGKRSKIYVRNRFQEKSKELNPFNR